jgi:predicted nucleotidyltransferase
MTRIVDTLRSIANALDSARAKWALVGGLAVGMRAEPRNTRDVDVCVAVASDSQAEALVFDLTGLGYRQGNVIEQVGAGRLATVRLHPPGQGPRGVLVDLLFASSGIEGEVVDAAERLELAQGLVVPVATIGHLVALKVLARDDRRRPQDQLDLKALLTVARAADLALARSALELVTVRRFHRQKQLDRELDRAIAELV